MKSIFKHYIYDRWLISTLPGCLGFRTLTFPGADPPDADKPRFLTTFFLFRYHHTKTVLIPNTMGTLSLPRLLTPAAFAVVFRVLSRDARIASRDNTRSSFCERRSRERSSSKKADAMGIKHRQRVWDNVLKSR